MKSIERRLRNLEKKTGVAPRAIPPRRKGETVDDWARRLAILGYAPMIPYTLYNQPPLPENWQPDPHYVDPDAGMTLEEILHGTWPENNPDLKGK